MIRILEMHYKNKPRKLKHFIHSYKLSHSRCEQLSDERSRRRIQIFRFATKPHFIICLPWQKHKMSRNREPPAGCIVYFMLSIVINLFILILRISAHELHNNITVATTIYHLDATTVNSSKASTEDNNETSKYLCVWIMQY